MAQIDSTYHPRLTESRAHRLLNLTTPGHQAPDSSPAPTRRTEGDASLPRVSVVVIAYGNGGAIGDCLESLYRQDYANKELLVVLDTSSRDQTAAVVRGFMKSHPLSRLKECSGVGRSRARNIGWRDCPSSVIMFADGDDLFEPWYLTEAIESLAKNPSAGGVCVGGTALVQGKSRVQRFHQAFGGTDSRIGSFQGKEPDWAWVYRRECLEEIGGFDESLSQAEDKDLCARVRAKGHRISYVGGINWYHRKPESLSSLLVKEYKGGRRRIVFEAKRRQYLTASVSMIPIIYIALCLVAILYLGLLYSAVLLVLGGFAYSILAISSHRFSPEPTDLLAFMPVIVAVRIVQSVGAVHGIALLALSRGGLAHPDFGRV